MNNRFIVNGVLSGEDETVIDIRAFLYPIYRLNESFMIDAQALSEEKKTETGDVLRPTTIIDMVPNAGAFFYPVTQEIHINFGQLMMLASFGSLEKLYLNLAKENKFIDEEILYSINLNNIVDEFYENLIDLDLIYQQGGVSTFFQTDYVSSDMYDIMVGFIYSHEANHFAEANLKSDIVNKDYNYIFGIIRKYIYNFRDKLMFIKDEHILMLNDIMYSGDLCFYKNWIEEASADYHAYKNLYKLYIEYAGYELGKLNLAVSMVFCSMRLMAFYFENFMDYKIRLDEYLTPSMRTDILGEIVRNEFCENIPEEKFYCSDWGVYKIMDILFTRILDELLVKTQTM